MNLRSSLSLFAPFCAFSRLSFFLCLSALFLSGCIGPRPLRGGHAITTGPVHQTLTQAENPAVPSTQAQETIKVRTYTLPAGSIIMGQPAPGSSNQNSKIEIQKLAEPMPVTEREETRAKTELGAAQKDTARELTAKLSSLKGIVWVGLVMFIFGIASLFWPPLKAIIGSVTTSAAITVGGLALMILPTLIVGNELLILSAVVVAVGGWFLAHRHGHLRGTLTSILGSHAPPSAHAPAPSAPVPVRQDLTNSLTH